MRFQYLLDRIEHAEFVEDPFPHLYLQDFMSEVDFKSVVTSEDVSLPPVSSIEELLAMLETASYEPITFPGCTESTAEYLNWINAGARPKGTHRACEGQGMALRLQRPANSDVAELDAFFRSPDLVAVLRAKFGITLETRVEAGVQKYLHGYEISPHPDIRQKALTWMLNINPSPEAVTFGFHTQYLKFKPEWSFISSLWQYNSSVQTCWVPWGWCDVMKSQAEDNSIVIFAPRWDTMHGVRAHYDHLQTQRTQFYGNFWFDGSDSFPSGPGHDFEDYEALKGPVRKSKQLGYQKDQVLGRLRKLRDR